MVNICDLAKATKMSKTKQEFSFPGEICFSATTTGPPREKEWLQKIQK